MMLCASVEFSVHVYLSLQLFVGFLNICWLNQISKFQEGQTLTYWWALFCRGKFPACEVPKFYRTPFHHRDLCTYPSVGVFPTGVTPTSKFVCVLPFRDGDARRHRDLSGFGQEKALRPAGERDLYYLAPKCLYRGEYRRGMVCVCVFFRV